jgi:hypothetical protein
MLRACKWQAPGGLRPNIAVEFRCYENAEGGSPGILRCGMNVLLALGCLLAVLLCVAGILLRDVVRSRRLQQRGRSLGLSFEPISEPVTGPQLKATSCLQDGCSTVAFNVLAGRVGGFQVRVFDLRDESFESPVLTTVAAFRSEAAELPPFEVGLKGFFGRIADALKAQSAAGGKEDLSKQFLIRSAADEKRIYEFLTPPRLERLRLYVNRYRLTCDPEWIFIYRPGKKTKAGELSHFLEETTRIAEALLACAPESQNTASGAAGGMLSVSTSAGR